MAHDGGMADSHCGYLGGLWRVAHGGHAAAMGSGPSSMFTGPRHG